MELALLEKEINEGDFEQFCFYLTKIPPDNYPQIKLQPKLGKISDQRNGTVKEDASIFLALRRKNYSPRTSLEGSKEPNLAAALEKINKTSYSK